MIRSIYNLNMQYFIKLYYKNFKNNIFYYFELTFILKLNFIYIILINQIGLKLDENHANVSWKYI